MAPDSWTERMRSQPRAAASMQVLRSLCSGTVDGCIAVAIAMQSRVLRQAASMRSMDIALAHLPQSYCCNFSSLVLLGDRYARRMPQMSPLQQESHSKLLKALPLRVVVTCKAFPCCTIAAT